MPELPDIVVYLEALEQRILGETLDRVTIASPFLLRTATPPIKSVEGRNVVALRRIGKRICIGLEEDLWLVLHLMIAGRLHWHHRPVKTSKVRLATFEFTNGTLSLTEAGSQRRASLHVVSGDAGLATFDRGGLEIFEIDCDRFGKLLQSENHTLKRSLTDPRLLSGIGNAYSDEILWEARLSPIALTQKLTSEEMERLFNSTRATLTKWIELLREDVKQTVSLRAGAITGVRTKTLPASSPAPRKNPDSQSVMAFPEKVTAFRAEMAVHGKYQQSCPRCGAKIQRIRYASNETNYCPNCQTGGKLLADRALSRLLRSDWPRSADELEGLTRQE